MKRKDIKALRSKSIDELKKELTNKRNELAILTLEKTGKAEKNNRIKRHMRDDLARIQTVIRFLQIQEERKSK